MSWKRKRGRKDRATRRIRESVKQNLLGYRLEDSFFFIYKIKDSNPHFKI